jgi:hypothetical protein
LLPDAQRPSGENALLTLLLKPFSLAADDGAVRSFLRWNDDDFARYAFGAGVCLTLGESVTHIIPLRQVTMQHD